MPVLPLEPPGFSHGEVQPKQKENKPLTALRSSRLLTNHQKPGGRQKPVAKTRWLPGKVQPPLSQDRT
jgi:hypothetical protein